MLMARLPSSSDQACSTLSSEHGMALLFGIEDRTGFDLRYRIWNPDFGCDQCGRHEKERGERELVSEGF